MKSGIRAALFVSFVLILPLQARADRLWLTTPYVEPRAVTLVIHGLNLRPEKMDELAALMTARGSLVLRLSLAGHHGDIDARRNITRDSWTDEVFQAYQEAREKADSLHVPFFFIGYSLGAVLNLDILVNRTDVRYDKMILFAPAIENKAPGWLMRTLRGILGKGGSLFSLNLEEYRAHSSTSFTMYVALLDSVKALLAKGLSSLSTIPTLVFLDPDDETVDYDDTVKLFKDSGLQAAWTVVNVSNQGSKLPKKYHHLMIDKEAVGEDQWRAMERAIDNHLGLLH